MIFCMFTSYPIIRKSGKKVTVNPKYEQNKQEFRCCFGLG